MLSWWSPLHGNKGKSRAKVFLEDLHPTSIKGGCQPMARMEDVEFKERLFLKGYPFSHYSIEVRFCDPDLSSTPRGCFS